MKLDQWHTRRLPRGGWVFSAAVDGIAGRWIRFGVFYGEAPGSNMAGKHFAAWRTRVDSLRGINVRAGVWPRPCVTVLLHTRPSLIKDAFRVEAFISEQLGVELTAWQRSILEQVIRGEPYRLDVRTRRAGR